MSARDLLESGQFKDLGYYIVSGYGSWDGRHCPNCGSQNWRWQPADTPEQSTAHCEECPTEWLSGARAE